MNAHKSKANCRPTRVWIQKKKIFDIIRLTFAHFPRSIGQPCFSILLCLGQVYTRNPSPGSWSSWLIALCQLWLRLSVGRFLSFALAKFSFLSDFLTGERESGLFSERSSTSSYSSSYQNGSLSSTPGPSPSFNSGNVLTGEQYLLKLMFM